jgi:hypothetical protein
MHLGRTYQLHHARILIMTDESNDVGGTVAM